MLAEIGDTAAWWGVGGAVLGALFSGFFTHYLTKDRDAAIRQSILDREADMRRRQFRKFLHCFRGRMERIDHGDVVEIWRKYIELAPEFKGEVALVSGDFSDLMTFAKLADAIGGWRYEDVKKEAERQGTNMRQVICDSIDCLIKFVEH